MQCKYIFLCGDLCMLVNFLTSSWNIVWRLCLVWVLFEICSFPYYLSYSIFYMRIVGQHATTAMLFCQFSVNSHSWMRLGHRFAVSHLHGFCAYHQCCTPFYHVVWAARNNACRSVVKNGWPGFGNSSFWGVVIARTAALFLSLHTLFGRIEQDGLITDSDSIS